MNHNSQNEHSDFKDSAETRSDSPDRLTHAQKEATDANEEDVASAVKKQRQDRKNRADGKPTSATENYGYRPELVDGDKQLIPGWQKKKDSDAASDQPIASHDKNDRIIEYEPRQVSTSRFALGLDYEDSRNAPLDAMSAAGEKIVGVAEGITNATTEGIQRWATDPHSVNRTLIATGESIGIAIEYYANKIANMDGEGFSTDLQQAGQMIQDASEAYSNLSPKDQGRIIGHDFMPAFLPDGPGIMAELKALGEAPEFIKASKALSDRFENSAGRAIKHSSGDLSFYLEKLPIDELEARMPQHIHARVECTLASESREAGRAIDRMYHPGKHASTEFVDAVYKALNTLPASDIKAVEQAGWRIRADRSIADIDIKLARLNNSSNEQSLGLTVLSDTPRSFWPGDKTKHSEIMMPEYAKLPDGNWISQIEEGTADYITRHEFGHAYAETKGMENHGGLFYLYRQCKVNASDEWQSLKNPSLTDQELSRINELQDIAHYMNKESGYSETLAELYAIDHGGLHFQWQTSLARQFEPLLDHLRRSNWYREK